MSKVDLHAEIMSIGTELSHLATSLELFSYSQQDRNPEAESMSKIMADKAQEIFERLTSRLDKIREAIHE